MTVNFENQNMKLMNEKAEYVVEIDRLTEQLDSMDD